MKSWTRRGAAAVAVFVPLSLNAQTPSKAMKDEDVTEEIIVTAQKRETALQDVPFSVAAVTAESIRRTGATNLAEVARNVSGLAITDLGPGQSQVAIRGISAGQVVRDQAGVKESVGIYLDESAISVALFTPDLDLYDVDRFEVLRGPQGTLFGAGSSSGTLRYITRQPELDVSRSRRTDRVDRGRRRVRRRGQGRAQRAARRHRRDSHRRLSTASCRASSIPSIPAAAPRRRQQRRANWRARVAALRADRKPVDHAARRVPEARDRRLSAHRRVQHPRQPVTTTEPAVTPGERGQVTQLREGLDRRVPTRRPHDRLRTSARHRADVGHLVHRSQRRSDCATRASSRAA